jgi:hypothetical protein
MAHKPQPGEGEPKAIQPPPPPSKRVAGLVVGYVAVVLLVDTLAFTRGATWPVFWAMFQWDAIDAHWFFTKVLHFPEWLTGWMVSWDLFQRVDFFKLVFWLVIPVCFSLWRLDWAFWGWRRVKKVERYLLLAAPVVAVCVMFAIPYLPGVRDLYQQIPPTSFTRKIETAISYNLYVFSWLLGWEFLHRYVLLRSACVLFPKHGWMLVVVSETAYHLVKPPLECAAMAVFSVCMTQYAMRRKNGTFPLLVHFIIENALLVFLLAR